jgi:hypothetical protein
MTDEKRRPEGNRAAPEKTLVGDSDQRSAEQHRRRAAMAAAYRVLAKCAANDTTVPKPNDATALAWAEHIIDAGLEYDTDLLLQAVTRVYSTGHPDGFRLRAWHVITAARELRQEAGMREPAAVREARQDARDRVLADAEDAADRVAAADGMVPIRGGSPFIVACYHPSCSAGPGRPCTTPALGRERVLSWSRAHPNRIARAAAERERDSPQAQRAAEEAARQDAIRALSRYRERNPQETDVMNGAERADLYRLAEQLAARPIVERDAP